jgi:hypothetical protein
VRPCNGNPLANQLGEDVKLDKLCYDLTSKMTHLLKATNNLQLNNIVNNSRENQVPSAQYQQKPESGNLNFFRIVPNIKTENGDFLSIPTYIERIDPDYFDQEIYPNEIIENELKDTEDFISHYHDQKGGFQLAYLTSFSAFSELMSIDEMFNLAKNLITSNTQTIVNKITNNIKPKADELLLELAHFKSRSTTKNN